MLAAVAVHDVARGGAAAREVQQREGRPAAAARSVTGRRTPPGWWPAALVGRPEPGGVGVAERDVHVGAAGLSVAARTVHPPSGTSSATTAPSRSRAAPPPPPATPSPEIMAPSNWRGPVRRTARRSHTIGGFAPIRPAPRGLRVTLRPWSLRNVRRSPTPRRRPSRSAPRSRFPGWGARPAAGARRSPPVHPHRRGPRRHRRHPAARVGDAPPAARRGVRGDGGGRRRHPPGGRDPATRPAPPRLGGPAVGVRPGAPGSWRAYPSTAPRTCGPSRHGRGTLISFIHYGPFPAGRP